MRSSALAVSAVLLVAALPPAPSQAAKKVYVSVDMEGISGISGDDQLAPGGAEYGRSRKLMAEDANAAVRGAFAAGATDVLVNDSHGGQRNLLPEDLDPRARLISHSFKPFGMMQGLDETFDAVIFVGYHAKAESPAGLFAHTGSGVVADVEISGRSVGEGGLNTLLAGWFGVPVVMVTGDDAAVAEVRAVAATARGVVVKKALNARAVELAPLAAARAEIEKTAREAVAASARVPAQRTGPITVRMRFKQTLIPEIAEAFSTITRPTPHSVAWTSETMPAAYRLVRVMYRYLSPD